LSRSIFFISDFSDGDGGTSFANTSSSVIPDDSPFSPSLLNDDDIIDGDGGDCEVMLGDDRVVDDEVRNSTDIDCNGDDDRGCFNEDSNTV
jgi:hypothetical protein